MGFAITAPSVGMMTPTKLNFSGRGKVRIKPPLGNNPAGSLFQEGGVRVLMHIGLVAFGSAIGGLVRWGVTVAAARWLGTAFPWGTLAINVSGSLFLGWFTTLLGDRLLQGVGWLDADALRLMIAVGFTGAYTTFSTFEYEAHGLLRDGYGLAAATYLFLSVFLGLAAVRFGVFLARG
jgi:CrcB protein